MTDNHKKRTNCRGMALLVSLVLIVSILTSALPSASADNQGASEEASMSGDMQPAVPDCEHDKESARNDTRRHVVSMNGQACIDGEVIVKFSESITREDMQNRLESIAEDFRSDGQSDGFAVVDVPDDQTMADFIDALAALPEVEYAQPNYLYQLDKTVNDPDDSRQWYASRIDVYDAWDVTMGSPDVKVAIIDTGIDTDHPEFEGQIALQADFYEGDTVAEDDNGHGTHVAGIIAAKADNNTGIAGIAPGVKLIVVDVFGWFYDQENDEYIYSALTEDIIHGINYAVDNGADVINMSFGSYHYDAAFEACINNAVSAGVVCVGASGNESTTTPHYPSDFESCISVIATTADVPDEIDYYSNYGPDKDISAPGESIYSTYIDGYETLSGTSMASPIVSAVAALILSVDPDLSVNEVKNILYGTAVDLGASGRDDLYGYGRVDSASAVYEALEGALPGTGTEADPYQISTPEQLNAVRIFPDAYFVMVNDIDMTAATGQGGQYDNSGKGWEPIGDYNDPFTGVFDGQGYSITGLYINRPDQSCIGLFGKTDSEDGSIENLKICGYHITGDSSVGAITGYNNDTKLSSCVTDGEANGRYEVGGITGTNLSGTISGCIAYGAISGRNETGGICGIGTGSILGCSNYADVCCLETSGGGIVGYTGSVTRNCYNYGSVYSKDRAGGIAGTNGGDMYTCFNTGAISRASGGSAGGIAGYLIGSITQCYNTGWLYTTSDTSGSEYRAGGIVGFCDIGTIRDCFNMGKTDSLDGFGGIVGSNGETANVYTCYNAFNESGEDVYDFIGEDGIYMLNVYFLYEGDEALGSGAKTFEELCAQSTFSGFNFTSVWQIVEGERFPVLRNVPFEYTTGMSLDKASILMGPDTSVSITPTILPVDASCKTIVWTSSDKSVATVDGSGIGPAAGGEMRIVSHQMGTATITARTLDGQFVDTCQVSVVRPVTGVTLSSHEKTLDIAEECTLAAIVLPQDATVRAVSWSSSNQAVATVDQSGKVRGVSRGTATITVTTADGGYTDTCTVRILQPVTGVALNANDLNIYIGDHATLAAAASPQDADIASVAWSSDNEGVATVQDGTVTGVGAGTAVITVTIDGFTDTCTVSVSSPPRIETSAYPVDRAQGTLAVPINTSVAQLKANLYNDPAYIKVFDAGGNEYADGALATGMKVRLIVNGSVQDELSIVIRGDTSGDGKISITDYTLVRLDILGLSALSGEYKAAGDVDQDGKINISDYTLIRLDILGLKSIY